MFGIKQLWHGSEWCRSSLAADPVNLQSFQHPENNAKPFVCAEGSCCSGIIKNQVRFVVLGIFLPAASATPGNTNHHKPRAWTLSTASGEGLLLLGHHTPGWHCQHHHPSPSLSSWPPKLSPHPYFPFHIPLAVTGPAMQVLGSKILLRVWAEKQWLFFKMYFKTNYFEFLLQMTI